MNNQNKALDMRENLKTALLQCYDMLLAKMQGDLYNEGKIYRITVACGATEQGEPLQVNLELNLQAKTFHPMHSIITVKELPFDSRSPQKAGNPHYAIHVEDLLSLKMD